MISCLARLIVLYAVMMKVLNQILQPLVISACMPCLAVIFLLTCRCRMSNGEQQPVRTVRRTNGAKKAAVAPDRAPNSPLTAEDIAALDEEARLTKIALWVYLAMFFDRTSKCSAQARIG